MNYDKIPEELKLLPQWVLFKLVPAKSGEYGKFDKLPVSQKTKKLASVSDSTGWCMFSELEPDDRHPYVGFCFTRDDPYVFIDLDNVGDKPQGVHKAIMAQFNTYQERSVSGNGVHIVCKGAFPQGRRKNNVEVYPHSRFGIFTGDVINGSPVNECAWLLEQLAGEMGTATPVETPQDYIQLPMISDAELVLACSLKYGDKWNELFDGEWSIFYASQSEADMALVGMLCMHTSDNEQVIRIFGTSLLAARTKAIRKDYLPRTITRIREASAREFEELDLQKIHERITQTHAETLHVDETQLLLPQGIINEMIRYILSVSVRPVPEIALAASLAIMAGICGRQYNVNGTGLNMYLLLLAQTGTGKEGISSGIDKLVTHLRRKCPTADGFVGPKSFASGPALVRALSRNPCFVSLLGEFGYTMQVLSDAKVGGPNMTLKQAMLDIYQKSGRDTLLKASAYSDEAKDVHCVQAPALTLLGESTPETFYNSVNEGIITDGLLPRFSIIEYKGGRPPRNRGNLNAPPSDELIEAMTSLFEYTCVLKGTNDFIDVDLTEEAENVLDLFDTEIDNNMNGALKEVTRHLWNRAHLKALKLSALLAISYDYRRPLITAEHANWAIAFVRKDIACTLSKFASGQLGDANKFDYEIKNAIKAYFSMDMETKRSFGVHQNIADTAFIPRTFFSKFLRTKSSFKSHPYGLLKAVEAAIDEAVSDGLIQQIPIHFLYGKTGLKIVAYTLGTAY